MACANAKEKERERERERKRGKTENGVQELKRVRLREDRVENCTLIRVENISALLKEQPAGPGGEKIGDGTIDRARACVARHTRNP